MPDGCGAGAGGRGGLLKIAEPGTFHTGLDDLRTALRTGPSRGSTHPRHTALTVTGVHVLGWWRGARRFVDDIGGSTSLEDVALNSSGTDLGTLIGDYEFEWHARPNRAMAVDRHDQKTQLIVPIVRPGTYDHMD